MYFKLYATSFLVKGYKKSTICDLQKQRFISIPNLLYEILYFNQHNYIHFDNLIIKYNNEKEGLQKFIDYLIKFKYGFFTNTPRVFPPLELQWDYPGNITNSILDFDINTSYNYKKIINNITKEGCVTFQLRFYESVHFEFINTILELINSNPVVENIEVIMPFHGSYKSIIQTYFKVTNLVLYNAKIKRSIYDEKNICAVIFSKESLFPERDCGKINPTCFSCNISAVTENLKYNSCLNRKISIDRNGKFKSCPSMQKDYGSANKVELKNVLNNKNYKKLAKLNKDSIKVCKDCEYRYVCSDCRAFTEDNNDMFAKPLKCKYNPYLAIWENK